MSTISLRLSDDESMLFKKYAKMQGISVSDLIRQSVLERIEDECDLRSFHEAMAEYEANPVTYTLNEVEKELGLK